MATQKPSKPSVTLPENFGGVKTAYTPAQIQNGYQEAVPQVVDGGNINYEKDALFQKLKYIESVVDIINGIPANRYLGVDSNNQFEYYDASTRNSYGNVGDIQYSVRKDVPYGGKWCDGSLYTKADFPDLYQMLLDNKMESVTISEYNNQISSNGSCGFFGLDSANERFKVPTLKNIYIKISDTNFGELSKYNIQTGSGGVAFNSIVCRAYIVVFTSIEDSTEATWNLKEDKSNKVNDLSNPNNITYLSTSGVKTALDEKIKLVSVVPDPAAANTLYCIPE